MESEQQIEGQEIYYMHKCSVWLKLAAMGIDPEGLYTHKAKSADWDLLASKLGLISHSPSPSNSSPGPPNSISADTGITGEIVQPQTADTPSDDTFQIDVLESEELEVGALFYNV